MVWAGSVLALSFLFLKVVITAMDRNTPILLYIKTISQQPFRFLNQQDDRRTTQYMGL
jgi:hypothetical protein